MNEPLDLWELVSRLARGAASAGETRRLEEELRADPVFRAEYIRYLHLDAEIRASILAPAAQSEVNSSARLTSESNRLAVRQTLRGRVITVAAVCLLAFLAGLAGTSLVRALGPSYPHAMSRALPGLVGGGFDGPVGPIPRGFPSGRGFWSGDESEIVSTAAPVEGTGCLRFIQPGVDRTRPQGPAVSCDVFQVIDLNDIRGSIPWDSEAVLELSALFRDTRTTRSGRIVFLCQIFQFAEDPAEIAGTWPLNIPQAVGSAATLVASTGGEPDKWLPAQAKCILSPAARFAVVQIGAKRPSPAFSLGHQYADKVALSLRTQPSLPSKISK